MLEWAHDIEHCPVSFRNGVTETWHGCPGDTSCETFPTLTDRCNMAEAAYREYSESDGTAFTDFVRDVLILAHMRHGLKLEDLHREASVAWMLANNIQIPGEIPL